MNAKLSPHELITGVVLAGGRGQRMGGVDKGLQVFRGKPLVQHALQGLSSQVGTVWINANRHQSDYAQWGHRVFSDGDESFAGPLSGMLAAMIDAEEDTQTAAGTRKESDNFIAHQTHGFSRKT